MISCLLIQLSRNAQGQTVRRESALTGEPLHIGRSAACKIHLLDHRVGMLHASIKHSDHGTICIEAEKDAVVSINGFIEEGAPLTPGTRVEIGPYQLMVDTPTEDHDIVLWLDGTEAQPKPKSAIGPARVPLTLAELGLSKRRMGFGLAAAIFFLFLILPVLPSLSPQLDAWQAKLPVTLTEAWNPGALSDGHAIFGAKCSICHRSPFGSVSDQVCVECHKQTIKHAGKDNATVFEETGCGTCHIDHRGTAGLVLHDSSTCTACHADLKAHKPKPALGNVRDFAADHPPFRLALPEGERLVRVRQDEKAALVTEKSGLKFSHQVHLVKKGLSTPEGTTVMTCRDCHRLEESGNHFAPMTMKGTCQQSECHVSYYPKPIRGVVPHGSERDAVTRLRDAYAKWLVAAPANFAACPPAPKTADTAARVLRCADELARKDGSGLFAEKGENLVCGECHQTSLTGDGDVPWKVAPPHLNRDWQPSAVFKHVKHGTVECTDCHDKTNSKVSADIAMPSIAKCRECHVGERGGGGKVRTACDRCHRFHQAATERGS